MNKDKLNVKEEKQHGFLGISKRAYVDFIAGCCGGAAGTLVGHPFDTVKVRLQTQGINVKSKHMYNGPLDCFMRIVKTEGVSGLFKGLTAPLLGLAGINAIIFGVHGNSMRYMQPGPKSEALAGGLAGMCQTIVICPVELAKTRLQMQGKGNKLTRKQKMYTGSLDCLLRIYRKEGIAGCYRGMVSTIIRDVPGFAAYFWLYYELCHLFIPKGKTMIDLTALQLLFCGGTTGIISWGLFYPIDVIKSRIQADGIAPIGKYKSNLSCVKISVQQDGFKVFFRGITACLIRAFPVNAVTFATVEATLKIIEKSQKLSSDKLDL